MTRAALRTLPDAALVDRAYAAGLTWSAVEPAWRGPCMDMQSGWCTWNPAVEVAQAQAIFRLLRDRQGWLFGQQWVSTRPEGKQGFVEILTLDAHYCATYGRTPATEARALLLVSLAAVEGVPLSNAETPPLREAQGARHA